MLTATTVVVITNIAIVKFSTAPLDHLFGQSNLGSTSLLIDQLSGIESRLCTTQRTTDHVYLLLVLGPSNSAYPYRGQYSGIQI